MPLRVSGVPVSGVPRIVRKLGGWTSSGNAWNAEGPRNHRWTHRRGVRLIAPTDVRQSLFNMPAHVRLCQYRMGGDKLMTAPLFLNAGCTQRSGVGRLIINRLRKPDCAPS